MNLREEIDEGFATLLSANSNELNKKCPRIKIESIGNEWDSYIFRFPNEYGVAFTIPENIEINEDFNNCRVTSRLIDFGEGIKYYLVLSTAFEEFRQKFATICADFIDPGDDGDKRKNIIQNPYGWRKEWKELLGNTSRDLEAYDLIAELAILAIKYKDDNSAKWSQGRSGSHDIECSSESCEVKSTTNRYKSMISITGQHQLKYTNPLAIYFCRMEKSSEGVSINDLKRILLDLGYDESDLENNLTKVGFDKGKEERGTKYKVLEIRKYDINDDFPKIINESFKDNKMPNGIVRIEYTVDLESVPYVSITNDVF